MDTKDVVNLEDLVLGSEIKFTLHLDVIDGDISKSDFTVFVYTNHRDKGHLLDQSQLVKKNDNTYVVFADSNLTGIGRVKALVSMNVSDSEAPKGVRLLKKLVQSNIVVIP